MEYYPSNACTNSGSLITDRVTDRMSAASSIMFLGMLQVCSPEVLVFPGMVPGIAEHIENEITDHFYRDDIRGQACDDHSD